MRHITITDMRVRIVNVPVKATHSHGSGDVSAIRSVVLELVADSGHTGWGEASPWPVFTGTAEASAAALNTHLRPHVVGANALRREQIMAAADRVVVRCSEAKAALEMALLDVVGKTLGLSVGQLIGGRRRNSVPVSFTVANPVFEEDMEIIAHLYGSGVRIFKLKTGFRDHRFDIMRLEKIRETYDEGVDLRIDYNQGLKAVDAIRTLRDMEPFRLGFIEQPTPRDNLEALAAISAAIDTPVMADESVFNPREALVAAQMRLTDIFSLKVMKSGGIARAQEIAAIAGAAGIGVYGGCMFETGLAHLAGAHLVSALPEIDLGCEFYMPTYYAKDDILTEPFPIRNGAVHIPEDPGLGIEVDTDKLDQYTVETLAAPA
ncbi:enolase C-terminal domain-like protein [Nitratireductor sp. XY-223]|uniref:enolase C-terminal domain-like protein n=1 Tax=Nitratireductor sp. XY-223 TaxID=2561926 RepID=UPI0010AABA77|nr:enolase C-terminal domain-like protein [Nitratireductor sp. XY-223]